MSCAANLSTATVALVNLLWLCSLLLCVGTRPNYYHYRQANGPIEPIRFRLVGDRRSPSVAEGRVELFHMGQWGTVCDAQFGYIEATVCCRSLGFAGSGRVIAANGIAESGGPIWLENVLCHGNETNLAECQHNPFGATDCEHAEDVHVRCSGQRSPLEFRLIDRSGRTDPDVNAGRVELKYQGIWGSVCRSRFGRREAIVLCRSLGYLQSAEVIQMPFHPATNNAPIWLDGFRCTGNETSLTQCEHNDFETHSCSHAQDVAVRCFDSPLDNRIDAEDDQARRQCGQVRTPPGQRRRRMVNGLPVAADLHPWQASVRIRDLNNRTVHFCGAVIVDRRHVLTAAHCLRRYRDVSWYGIRIADGPATRDVRVQRKFIHPGYRHAAQSIHRHDIALVRLAERLQFDDYVQPICLPGAESSYEPNRVCTISGWLYEQQTEQGEPRLSAANVPMLADEACRHETMYGAQIEPEMFCAGWTGHNHADTTKGDSGGPLVCAEPDGTRSLYGLVSWGDADKPGVYVKVSQYVDWIRGHIGDEL